MAQGPFDHISNDVINLNNPKMGMRKTENGVIYPTQLSGGKTQGKQIRPSDNNAKEMEYFGSLGRFDHLHPRKM